MLSDIELILSGFYSSGPNDQRGTIKYREEDRFTLIAEFVDIYSSRNELFSRGGFKIFFSGIQLAKIGLKIAKVFLDAPQICQARMESKCFENSIQVFKSCSLKKNLNLSSRYGFIFQVKLPGSATNFFYQLIDENWMDQMRNGSPPAPNS